MYVDVSIRRYAKYAFQALDPAGRGFISVEDFTKLLFTIRQFKCPLLASYLAYFKICKLSSCTNTPRETQFSFASIVRLHGKLADFGNTACKLKYRLSREPVCSYSLKFYRSLIKFDALTAPDDTC